jgi:hypothetical protein
MKAKLRSGAEEMAKTAIFHMVMLCTILTGCSLGPTALKGNRLDYNTSIHKSNGEELLLNLVRAKYFEQPFFLLVGAVSSSFDYSASLGANRTFLDRQPPSNINTTVLSLGAEYSEKPTITYTPLQGEQNAKRLLSELNLEEFVLLARAGCPMDILLRMLVKQVGNLNASPVQKIRAGDAETSYDRFLMLARMLRKLQGRGDLEFVRFEKDKLGVESVIMQLRYSGQQEAEKLEGLLGIEPERLTAPDGRIVSVVKLMDLRDLAGGIKKEERGPVISLRLRNFIQVLYFLAWGVEVPEDHIEEGIARSYRSPEGKTVDLRDFFKDLFRVGCSWSRPWNAYVAVCHRGRWFSIADNDLQSKEVFSIVSALFDLQSKEVQGVAPLLTLPVGS